MAKTVEKKEIKVPVMNTQGKEVDQIVLDPDVFDGTVNSAVIYQAVNAYRANQHKGTAATKTRGEVSGGGKKPWRQKGTGRARVGSSRNPLWRHGGVVFGPHPRDFSVRIPQKIKSEALKASINAKVKDNDLVVLDALKLDNPKTSDAQSVVTHLKIDDKSRKRPVTTLIVVEKPDQNIRLGFRNLAAVDVALCASVHCYAVLAHRKLVITRSALEELTRRLKNNGKKR